MTQSNYVLAEDPAVDLALVQAMAEELEDYLVKDDLFRQMTVRTPAGDQRPQMSGSDLLVRLHRLHGERDKLTPAQQTALDQVQTSVDATIHSLRTRFLERLERDMKSRLNSLRWFIDDCRQDRKRCRSEFPYEIRNRQRIEEILKVLGDGLGRHPGRPTTPDRRTHPIHDRGRRLHLGRKAATPLPPGRLLVSVRLAKVMRVARCELPVSQPLTRISHLLNLRHHLQPQVTEDRLGGS